MGGLAEVKVRVGLGSGEGVARLRVEERRRTAHVERHEYATRSERPLTAAAHASTKGRIFSVIVCGRAEERAESAGQCGHHWLRRWRLEDSGRSAPHSGVRCCLLAPRCVSDRGADSSAESN